MLQILLPLAIVGAVGLALLDLVIRKPLAGAAIFFSLVVLDHSNAFPPGMLELALNIGPNDLVAALLAAAAVARFLRMRHFPTPHRMLFLLVGLAVFSIITGVLQYGQGAVSEARPWVYFLSSASYFASLRLSQEEFDRIARYWVWAAVAIMAVAYLRWGALAGSLPSVSILSYDRGDLRVVRARETLLMAQAFLIVAPLWRNRTHLMYRWLGVALLATVILMRHRTLWAAIVLALVVIWVREPDLGRRFGGLMVVAVLVGGGLFTAFLGGGEEQVEASASSSSFEWRFAGWVTLMTDEGPENALDTAFGMPFGSGWGREVQGVSNETRPHSHYVEALLRMGASGLLAMLACYATVARHLWRKPPERFRGLLNHNVLLYLLVIQVAFSVTYDLRHTGGLVLGLALARLMWTPERTTELPQSGGMALPV